MNKDYIVSLNVSFSTPISVSAKTDAQAEVEAKAKFRKLFSEFKKKLMDIADENIDVEYVEED